MYLIIYMSAVQCSFSYHKIAHHTTQYGAIHCHLWSEAGTPFCGKFWLVWVCSCGLSGLVKSYSLPIIMLFREIKIVHKKKKKNEHTTLGCECLQSNLSNTQLSMMKKIMKLCWVKSSNFPSSLPHSPS